MENDVGPTSYKKVEIWNNGVKSIIHIPISVGVPEPTIAPPLPSLDSLTAKKAQKKRTQSEIIIGDASPTKNVDDVEILGVEAQKSASSTCILEDVRYRPRAVIDFRKSTQILTTAVNYNHSSPAATTTSILRLPAPFNESFPPNMRNDSQQENNTTTDQTFPRISDLPSRVRVVGFQTRNKLQQQIQQAIQHLSQHADRLPQRIQQVPQRFQQLPHFVPHQTRQVLQRQFFIPQRFSQSQQHSIHQQILQRQFYIPQHFSIPQRHSINEQYNTSSYLNLEQFKRFPRNVQLCSMSLLDGTTQPVDDTSFLVDRLPTVSQQHIPLSMALQCRITPSDKAQLVAATSGNVENATESNKVNESQIEMKDEPPLETFIPSNPISEAGIINWPTVSSNQNLAFNKEEVRMANQIILSSTVDGNVPSTSGTISVNENDSGIASHGEQRKMASSSVSSTSNDFEKGSGDEDLLDIFNDLLGNVDGGQNETENVTKKLTRDFTTSAKQTPANLAFVKSIKGREALEAMRRARVGRVGQISDENSSESWVPGGPASELTQESSSWNSNDSVTMGKKRKKPNQTNTSKKDKNSASKKYRLRSFRQNDETGSSLSSLPSSLTGSLTSSPSLSSLNSYTSSASTVATSISNHKADRKSKNRSKYKSTLDQNFSTYFKRSLECYVCLECLDMKGLLTVNLKACNDFVCCNGALRLEGNKLELKKTSVINSSDEEVIKQQKERRKNLLDSDESG